MTARHRKSATPATIAARKNGRLRAYSFNKAGRLRHRMIVRLYADRITCGRRAIRLADIRMLRFATVRSRWLPADVLVLRADNGKRLRLGAGSQPWRVAPSPGFRTLVADLVERLARTRPDLETRIRVDHVWQLPLFALGCVVAAVGFGVSVSGLVLAAGEEFDSLLTAMPVLLSIALTGVGIAWLNRPWAGWRTLSISDLRDRIADDRWLT